MAASRITNQPPLLPNWSQQIHEGSETKEDSSERHRRLTSTTKKTAAAGFLRRRRRTENVAVSCNNCRPSSNEKMTTSLIISKKYAISVPSPNGILKFIFSRPSPKLSSPPPPSSDTCSSSAAATRRDSEEDPWKITVAELSDKLVRASRKRDEAIQEASKLNDSMATLEKKLDSLVIHCRHSLEICSENVKSEGHDQIINNFLVSVSEARSAVRLLSRALTVQITRMPGAYKVLDRISSLLIRPNDLKLSSRNPGTLVLYLEALLNHALFEDFESPGFAKNSTTQILNPSDRCVARYAAFGALRGLTWEEVVCKGTRHFSDEFSRFCDRKMSDIVGLLGWNRAWNKRLLRAFFWAAKTVWLVHLLANSVHPSLPVFRVEKGSEFDPVYMEVVNMNMNMNSNARRLVRILVCPGFYVYDMVVKCKVLCICHNETHHSHSHSHSHSSGGRTRVDDDESLDARDFITNAN